MFYRPDGVGYFNTMPELLYDMFIEMGLSVRRDQYLYDQDTGNILLDGEKYIKASIDPNTPLYAGRTDIIFEPAKNYQLIDRLFGFYLDKCQNSDDGDILQGYVANYIEDDNNKEKQRVSVKTLGRGIISSNFYYCIYLAYIDCIFRIAGYNPDLSNFDIKEDMR